jgi:hypothetical protein
LAKDFGPSAFAFRQSFIKILTKFQQKYIGLGPTSQSSTPRFTHRSIHLQQKQTKVRAGYKHQTPEPEPKPRAHFIAAPWDC